MKHDWEYKKLGEVASYINGFAFKPEQWTTEGVPIIRIQNLNNPDAPFNYYDGVVPDKVKIKDGDLLISWSASLGAYIWNGGDAFLNQHIFKVEFDKGNINKYFLKYAVSSKLEVMSGLVHGATMKHIVKKDFDETRIPYPPLPVQEQIVSELDKVSEIIEKKKQQLEELDNLAQSIFYDMFGDPVENEKGWEVVPFDTICNGMTKGPFGSDIKKSLFVPKSNDTIKVYIQMNAIQKNEELGEYYISKEYFESKMSRFEIFPQDYIITCDGTLGKYLRLSDNMERGIISASLLKLTLNNTIEPKYFECLWDNYLLSSLVKQTRNAALVHLPSAKVIGKEQIPLPPLSLQQTFAKKIEAIEHQKELINQSIKETQTLFDSRMDYYFGE